MSRKIYVGNLHRSVTNADLEALFAPHGAVRSAEVIVDRETGRSRGFAFVEMETNTGLENAIAALEGHEINGRSLKVNECREHVRERPSAPEQIPGQVSGGFACRECGSLNEGTLVPNRFTACRECHFDNTVYMHECEFGADVGTRRPRGSNYVICKACGAEYQKSKGGRNSTNCPQCRSVNGTVGDVSTGGTSKVVDSKSAGSESFSWRTFGSVLAAIVVAVALFAPERLPSGWGLGPVPLRVDIRDSLVGEGKVAMIQNPTGKTLHNVVIVCRSPTRETAKQYLEETWAPGRVLELGWAEGWRWEKGEKLTISASGFYSCKWDIL